MTLLDTTLKRRLKMENKTPENAGPQLCAFVGESEIIPFENIDFVDFTMRDRDQNTVEKVTVSTVHKGELDIYGRKNCDEFIKQYKMYLRFTEQATFVPEVLK